LTFFFSVDFLANFVATEAVAIASELLDLLVPAGCGARLRPRHFPDPRRLTVYDGDFPV
jgi:hypothetical protein